MAPYESDDAVGAAQDDNLRSGRRKAARYGVPVAVVGVAAATIGLVPALADSGDPDLPRISAEQLIEKIAKSDVQQLSGTVKVSTDLGLPDLGGLEEGLLSRAGEDGSGDGSSADPQAKLTELVSGTHTLRVAADGRTGEALPPGARRRVQPDPRRQGRLGLRQQEQRGLPLHHGRLRQGPPGRAAGHAQGLRRRGPEGGGRHHVRHRRRHRAGRRARRLQAADPARAVRHHGRRDQHRRGREDGHAAEVHADPEERRRRRARRGLHPGVLRQAGRLHVRLHPAQGREGHRGEGTRHPGTPRSTARTSPRASRARTGRRSSARAGPPSPPSTPAPRAACRPAPRAVTSEASSARSASRSTGSSARARSSPPAWSTP